MMLDRRDFIKGAGALISSGSLLGADNNLQTKLTNFIPRAKNVIFLFMEGGPSHIDSFDPKPLVNKYSGKPLPESMVKDLIVTGGELRAPILASKRTWKQHGQSGLWVSDWLPHTAKCADDLCVIKSLWANGINHAAGVSQMNTGSPLAGRPSLGAWITYALGTDNPNLPAFIVMKDKSAQTVNGVRNWGTGFMPAIYQGTLINSGKVPISNLYPKKDISNKVQQDRLRLLKYLNNNYQSKFQKNGMIDAISRNYDIAFKMQKEAPNAVNIDNEAKYIKEMYGLNNKATSKFGRMCLMARRLVENGVRFIQLYSGTGSGWDAHTGIEDNHTKMFRSVDQPISALLMDLKQRGMLDNTLVIWGGEFGRTPISEKGSGRDHNPTGFTMWLAGGGAKGGTTIGATDEFGLRAVQDKMHVHDFHSTILAMLGVDHTSLIYRHQGRNERIDQNEGVVNEKIFI